MSYIAELFHQVFSSLFRNKLRSFLTMAGIAWGIASIVLIVAMGEGFKEGQRNNMKSLGENIVILFGGRTAKQAGGQRAGRRIRLTHQDVTDIRTECYFVRHVTGELENNARVVSSFNSGSFDSNGVESNYTLMRNIPIGSGHFFTDADQAEGRRVCVIGLKVKKQLFGTRNDVAGRQIAINSLPFQIIAVMADKNQDSSYNGMDEEKIYMPYSTMVRDLPPKENYTPGNLSEIIFTPKTTADSAPALKQVRRVIGRNHRFDPQDTGALGVWDTIENAQQVDAIFESMTMFLSIIALVTLTLGGVGVMNIMLVTVSERTREIGLRKALGATRARILVDFMVEGAILAFVSGMAGWAVAFGLSSLLKLAPMPEAFPGLPVSMTTTALTFGALTVIAIASSLFPAWRAAALTPVEALRYER
ncbi:MAG: efflux pump, inner rane subunit [Bryobacterales bacterium]|nr:efflux pump, inner rane subunit [Bryobacterales bacterium]